MIELVQLFFFIVVHHFLDGFHEYLFAFDGWVACIFTMGIAFATEAAKFVGITGAGAAHFVSALHVANYKKARNFQVDHFADFAESDLHVAKCCAILAMDVATENRLQDLMQPRVFEVHPKLLLLVGGCSKANIVDISKRAPSSWEISHLLVQD